MTTSPRDSAFRDSGLRATMGLGVVTAGLLFAMPSMLGFDAANANRKLDAQLAKLGSHGGFTESMHFAETDNVPGADRRWSFPTARAAQLQPGESMVFMLPGGSGIEMPLVERMLLDERSIQFTFADLAAGNAAEITVREGVVRGTLRVTIGKQHFAWSLSSRTDANGLAGDYYDDIPAGDNGADGVHESIDPPAALLAANGEGGVAGNCQDTGQIIDVLLAYTPNFATLFATPADLQAALTADIGLANSALANSNAVPRFRIAGFYQTADNGTGSLTTDLNQLVIANDNWNDAVHAQRNLELADLVVLYSDSATSGSAAFIGIDNGDVAAFSVIGRSGGIAPNISTARALGANMGCCSQTGATPACTGYYAFSHAWEFTAGAAQFQTVMASGTAEVVPVYSNPLVQWLQEPTGTATANNARTASLTANIVANYRCSSSAAIDCDGDGVPDEQAIANNIVPDCNFTGIPDSCDIALGISLDLNNDGIPDECPLTDIEFAAGGVTTLDTLGSAVGIASKSGDPTTIAVIGAPGSDVGASNAGAAYLVAIANGQIAPLAILRAADPLANAFFGRGATVYKRAQSLVTPLFPARNFALVGAYRWTETATVGTFPSKGAIYLFAEDINGWNQLWRYTPPATGGFQAREYSLFGYALAMGRNPREGVDQIVVGAPGRNAGRGAVYIIRNYFVGGVERAGLQTTRALLGTPTDGDNFGAAVALEPFLPVGPTSRVIMVVGAPGRDGGKGGAYVYDRPPSATGGVGTFPTAGFTLTPTGGGALAVGDLFGTAVAISGNLVAVGAPGASNGAGVVHFWERSTTVITPNVASYAYRGTFKAPDGVAGDALGSSISIAPAVDGNGFTVVVGAPKADLTVPGGVRTDAGKIYVLRKTIGQTGAVLTAIRASTNPATGDQFGYSAASTRGFSLTGAPFSDVTGLNSGKARLMTTP